jgi:hypothetical protein
MDHCDIIILLLIDSFKVLFLKSKMSISIMDYYTEIFIIFRVLLIVK